MHRVVGSIIWVCLLAGCRADFVSPPVEVDWDEVLDRPWQVASSSRPQQVPEGSIFYFGEDDTYLLYRSNLPAECGIGTREEDRIDVELTGENGSVAVRVKQQKADSLFVSYDGSGGEADLVFTHGNAPSLLYNREATNMPEGYTVTTANGTPVSWDQSDWRAAPSLQCGAFFEPVFPNPASLQDSVTLRITLDDPRLLGEGILVTGYNANSNVTRLTYVPHLSGVYQVVKVPLRNLEQSGLSRLFVYNSPDGILLTYGDIMVHD